MNSSWTDDEPQGTQGVIERGFAHAEFADRASRAQAMMAEQGIAALWFTTEPEFRYYTGFLTQFWLSPTRPWHLLLPATGKPLAVIPEIGVPLLARSWIDDIRSWPAPAPSDDGISLLASAIQEVAQKGDVGMPMGPETTLRMPLADLHELHRRLPNRFVDASPIVRAQRMHKSGAEIAKIGQACKLAGRAFAALPNLIRAGTPLDLTFRKFRSACMNAGLDDVPYLAGAAGSNGYTDVISPPSVRPLASGDILMLDTGAVFDGYFCDFDRNFAIGQPNDTSRRAYDRLYEATEIGLAAAKPGVTCAELFACMNRALGSGENNVGRLGHGLGMQLTEWPSIAAFDHTVLRPNMVITLEPAISTIDGHMLVQEEDIVITESGCQLLTDRAPQSLPVIA